MALSGESGWPKTPLDPVGLKKNGKETTDLGTVLFVGLGGVKSLF